MLASLEAAGVTYAAMWDADSGDGVGASFEQERATYDGLSADVGHVVLNHDTLAATAQDLVPFVIDWARARGLKMVTLATCLGLPAEAAYRDVGVPGTRDPTWTCT